MTESQTPAERWKYMANLRQGIISRLEKKVRRLESELAAVKASREADASRLAMYDRREAA